MQREKAFRRASDDRLYTWHLCAEGESSNDDPTESAMLRQSYVERKNSSNDPLVETVLRQAYVRQENLMIHWL